MGQGAPTSSEERFWREEASRVSRRFNLGWWIDRANRLLVPGFLVFSALVLVVRSSSSISAPPIWLGWLALGIALGGALAAWLWSRGRFVATEQSLVRLDDRLHLRGALSTAAAGVGSWPARRDAMTEAFPEWRWSAVLLPTALVGIVAALAWWVPLPERTPVAPEIAHEPDAWDRMDTWIDTLEEEQLIEPESLREVEEKLAELREKPREEWFSHSNMEATDTLEESFGRDIAELSRDLATLERDLEALRTFSTELSESGKEMLMREFGEALQSLQSNGLEINEGLAKQLSELDLSQLANGSLANLSSEQLKNLQKQLGEGAEKLGSMEGVPCELCEGEGLGFKPGEMPGRGGINRGRADAPLFFGDEQDIGTNKIEAVKNEDLSRARIGDALGVGVTEHEIDESATGPTAGGDVSSPGQGGEAVWRDSLVPSEQAVLKRYFD